MFKIFPARMGKGIAKGEESKQREKSLLNTILYMLALVIILAIVAWIRSPETLFKGIMAGFGMLGEVVIIMVLSFLVAGLIQTLVPKEMIVAHLGRETGIRGILFGSFAGAFMPGGPYINFPIAASIYRSGAGIGSVVGFVSGWALWQVYRLPIEMALISPRFALIRFTSTLVVPPLAGLLAHYVFRR